MNTVLFVCTGNTCRSPMAAGMLKHLLEKSNMKDIQVVSAGLAVFFEDQAHQNAIETMREMDIDIAHHRSQQISEKMLHDAGLILTMTQSHKEQILILLPELRGRIFTLLEFAREDGEEENMDIRDPYALPMAEYRRTAQQMKHILERALPKIIKFFSS